MICYKSNEKEQFVKTELVSEYNPGAEMQLVKVYPKELKQEMIGFGGAFTEAAAYTYSKMSKEQQEQVLELYFGEQGNRYNFCRLHIQSCDFALGNYAYIEDEFDKELNTFSLERDKEYIIPFVKDALNKNSKISFLASPWSPPGFMKSNKEMNHGGKLEKEYYSMWADMIATYVEEYEKLGIKVERITIQNEPQATQTWDSCIFTAEEESEFACDYLKEAFLRKGLGHVKINIWDHNKDCILERAMQSLETNEARDTIDGIAFHWYSGDHFEELAAVRDKYPDKELIFTEGCVEYSRFSNNNQVSNAEMYAHDMIGNLNAGTNGSIDWNLLLDEKGGPNHVGNFCDAPIMYNTNEGQLDIKLSYYYIGHISKFVKPGARRMLVSRYTDKIDCVGFVNQDGEKILVVLNRTEDSIKFDIACEKEITKVECEAHTIMTFVW